jgi:hypothetical protein
LASRTQLKVKTAEDGERVQRGTVYIAPANHHLLVKEDQLKVTSGPRENGARPAIDPLFRSMGDPQLERFRCHLGHGYTGRTLLVDQTEAVEQALWLALRTLEQRSRVLERMARNEKSRGGRMNVMMRWEEEAEETKKQVQLIRDVLVKVTS